MPKHTPVFLDPPDRSMRKSRSTRAATLSSRWLSRLFIPGLWLEGGRGRDVAPDAPAAPRPFKAVLCAAALAIGLGAQGAFAQGAASETPKWPTKPIRIVVGFGGGSSPDLVARAIADPLSKALGQPVIVDNRPGASGNIAADIVAKSTDQHTIGMLINGNMTVAKILNPATPYDPLKDLAPISLICVAPLVLAAPMDAPGTDGRIFLAAAKAAGNRWSYGSPGIGTVGHLGMELLKSRTGIAPVHVPYLGNPQVIGGLIGGQLQISLLPPGLAAEQVKAGRLRAIGVTSLARSPLVPDYPTLGEAGVENFQLEIWTAAAGPATMPQPIIDRLSKLIGEITRTPEVRQRLHLDGYEAVGSPADVLAARIKADTALLSNIIVTQGVRLE